MYSNVENVIKEHEMLSISNTSYQRLKLHPYAPSNVQDVGRDLTIWNASQIGQEYRNGQIMKNLEIIEPLTKYPILSKL